MAQQETQPLAICLTETWLKNDSNIKCSSFSSYQLLDTCNLQIDKWGGVVFFAKKGVVITVLEKFSSTNCQWLTIKNQSKNYEKDLVLTVVFLKPYTSSSELSKTFEEFKPKQKPLKCEDLIIDHSKTNAKLSTSNKILGGCDLNNMSLTGFTRETIISQKRTD